MNLNKNCLQWWKIKIRKYMNLVFALWYWRVNSVVIVALFIRIVNGMPTKMMKNYIRIVKSLLFGLDCRKSCWNDRMNTNTELHFVYTHRHILRTLTQTLSDHQDASWEKGNIISCYCLKGLVTLVKPQQPLYPDRQLFEQNWSK